MGNGDTEREIFHSLVHSPNSHNSQRWASTKLGVRGFFQVSYVGSGTQNLEPCMQFSQAISRALDPKCSRLDSDQCPHGMLTPLDRELAC